MSAKVSQMFLVVVSVLAAIWLLCIQPHTTTWDDTGEINLFPVSSVSKNYRVNANIHATIRSNGLGFNEHRTYGVGSVVWPNGGYSILDGCIVKQGERAKCSTIDGDEYTVEVMNDLEPPEAE